MARTQPFRQLGELLRVATYCDQTGVPAAEALPDLRMRAANRRRFLKLAAGAGRPGPPRVGSWHQTATSWRSAFRKQYEFDYRSISHADVSIRAAWATRLRRPERPSRVD